MCTCLGVCLGFCLVSGLLPEHACICVGVWVVALDLTVSELLSGLVSALWDLVAWVVVCGILLPGVCAVVSGFCHAVSCGILLSAVSCYLRHSHTGTLGVLCYVPYMRARTCVLVHACSYMRARTSVHAPPVPPCIYARMRIHAFMHACVRALTVCFTTFYCGMGAGTDARAVLGCVKHVARRKTCLRDQNAGVGIHVLPRSSRRPLPLPPRRSH